MDMLADDPERPRRGPRSCDLSKKRGAEEPKPADDDVVDEGDAGDPLLLGDPTPTELKSCLAGLWLFGWPLSPPLPVEDDDPKPTGEAVGDRAAGDDVPCDLYEYRELVGLCETGAGKQATKHTQVSAQVSQSSQPLRRTAVC